MGGAYGYNAVGDSDKEHSMTSYLNLSDVEKKQVERYCVPHFTGISRNYSNNCSTVLLATRLVILALPK